MKFGKALLHVIDMCDPEWGPFWINYKELKKCINEIPSSLQEEPKAAGTGELGHSGTEVNFFRLVKREVKKVADFYCSSVELLSIRRDRIRAAYNIVHDDKQLYDKQAWTRLLASCVGFYKDLLLLENFAIMNYCGFSKILKKHDKHTRRTTREAFMRKVVYSQKFARYVCVLELLKDAEKIFDIVRKVVHSEKCLMSEEVLFIEVLRDLNQQAGKYQAEEQLTTDTTQSITSNKQSVPTTTVALGSLLFDRTSSPPSSGSSAEPPAAPQPKVPSQLHWIHTVQKNKESVASLKRKCVAMMEV